MKGAYLERSAYQVMSAMVARFSEREEDYFNAMLGAITATPLHTPQDPPLQPAEYFMRVCEAKGDYSFIYSVAPRSQVRGRCWRPFAKSMVAILPWHSWGSQSGSLLAWHPELIFLNPGEEICLRNCRNRQWEPHKYPSKAEKDSIRETLFDWVSAYYTCTGSMSLAGHQAIYDAYDGPKRELTGFSIESHG
jgi:hypothetical protein